MFKLRYQACTLTFCEQKKKITLTIIRLSTVPTFSYFFLLFLLFVLILLFPTFSSNPPTIPTFS